MSNSWYPRYYGDFMRDTGHLSLVEVGAYNRLLDHYYASGGPIPADRWQLLRICHAVANDEQDAVTRVCREFFTKDGTALRNKRADREIAKLNDISTKRSEAGQKGAETRYGKGHSKRIASATTSTSTSTTTDTPTRKRGKPRPAFKKPTPEEVTEYAKSIGYDLSGKYFCDKNDSIGWVVGKNRSPMKDWKAVVRTWQGKDKADKKDQEEEGRYGPSVR